MMSKKKKIIELERQISKLKQTIEEKNNEISTLNIQSCEDKRHCSELCQRCIHAISYYETNFCGTYKRYMCELDNKCKDYRTCD